MTVEVFRAQHEETAAEIVARRRTEVPMPGPPSGAYAFTKRALDITVAVVGLLVTAPIMVAIAVALRLESPGRAVFRQRRVGQDGREFSFYKFRTMFADAKERFPELYDYTFSEHEFSTMYYKPAKDPRNTRVGTFLRKTTLDELPNLFNVLMGQVSLVGPRPELPEIVRYYRPDQLAKFAVKSGITGLAQVSGRNRLTVQEQIDLDVAYACRPSLGFDLRILGRTVVAVVRQIGAE
jgi:lipopolysaccharide/colanic/teichoic acid biosynthesis glycosyltransferase